MTSYDLERLGYGLFISRDIETYIIMRYLKRTLQLDQYLAVLEEFDRLEGAQYVEKNASNS